MHNTSIQMVSVSWFVTAKAYMYVGIISVVLMGAIQLHSDITYHVLQIIHSESLPQVVEDSWTILLELEVTGEVLSGEGTEKNSTSKCLHGMFYV